jgi:tryptophan halogenase
VKPYTTAETMNSGWCWQIEHDDRINRGYVYSSAFISDDEAEREFRQKCPKIDGTRLVKFVTGAYERGWVKNVVAIGNSSGFVEPLESTSLGVIAEESRNLAESLADCQLQPGLSMAAVYNKRNGQTWDDIRRFLAIHYRYNTRLDTPFWRACVADADIGSAADAVAYYQENGPSVLWRDNLIGGRDVFGFEGYLAMLVGQKVPYRNTYPIPERERRQWNEIQQANKAEAMKGFTVRQACDLIRSPNWKYRGNFYCIASDRG